MAHVFVFTNHKGGIGKSTSATNIAFGLSSVLKSSGAPNKRVLLIDTDSQAHATLVTDPDARIMALRTACIPS